MAVLSCNLINQCWFKLYVLLSWKEQLNVKRKSVVGVPSIQCAVKTFENTSKYHKFWQSKKLKMSFRPEFKKKEGKERPPLHPEIRRTVIVLIVLIAQCTVCTQQFPHYPISLTCIKHWLFSLDILKFRTQSLNLKMALHYTLTELLGVFVLPDVWWTLSGWHKTFSSLGGPLLILPGISELQTTQAYKNCTWLYVKLNISILLVSVANGNTQLRT